MTVAALYVDPKGPYPKLGEHVSQGQVEWRNHRGYVDCWDASRDARKYDGPYPVVAHPPCKHWGRLRHLANVQCLGTYGNNGCGWSGTRSKLHREPSWSATTEGCCPICGGGHLDSDSDCALRAVEQVRKWGGVLEHPAGSKLWEACGLPKPHFPEFLRFPGNESAPLRTDEFGGWAIELDQVEWGYVARKRTWLYLVGVPREALEAPPYPGREPTRSVSGKRGAPTQAKHPTWREQLPRASDSQRRRTPPLFAEYLVRLARAVPH